MCIESTYKPDILGEGFEQLTIHLDDDHEGKVTATLVRKLSTRKTDKAVLYIHGFNDYFFQKEMANNFTEKSLNFYALDLRKYGRSLLPHQTFNDSSKLKDYYQEILKSLDIIRKEGNEKTYLMGHSTGGLIITLFAKDYSSRNLFDGIILNSPFFDFNLNQFVKFFIPLVSVCTNYIARIRISGRVPETYGKSLHLQYHGEWIYNLDWKRNFLPDIQTHWVRAIHKAQKELKSKFSIEQPVLLLHSAKSVNKISNRNQVKTRDLILNVEDMIRIGNNIHDNVEITSIEGGLHDLILSEKNVRNKVYRLIFNWLDRKHQNL